MRTRLNIDGQDIIILLLCSCRRLSVSELQKQLGIAYNNMKPHIRKLEELGYLLCQNNGKGKKKFLTTNLSNYQMWSFVEGMAIFFSTKFPEVKEILDINEKQSEQLEKLHEGRIKMWKENNKDFLKEQSK